MRISSLLIRRSVVSAFGTLALTLAAEGVALADCPYTVRAATAEEQKFHADTFAQFQKTAPPAPAGWTASDGAATGVLKEVCAPPGERVLRASFNRSYARAAQEVAARDAEAVRKIAALMQENQAAMKAGKPVNFDAMDAASKKIDAEARRDTSASFSFSMGVTDLSSEGFSPVAVPVGKGYRLALTEHGVTRHDVIIVLNPATPAKSGQTVVKINGDPARVDELLKAAPLR